MSKHLIKPIMKNNFQTILFDLDGTICDPKIGITRCVQYALGFFDITEPHPENLCRFIGPPLKDSFMQYYGLDEPRALQAIQRYRERYSEIGIYEVELYPGMADLLKQLAGAGKQLIIATTKPAVYALRILEYFKIQPYFRFVSGSELDNTRTRKGDVIAYGLEQSNVADLNKTVMIGDREHDVLGAKEAGIACIGVLYGYGSYSELEGAGADYIVNDIESLARILL